MAAEPEDPAIRVLVDGLFRGEFGKLVSTLARVLGPANISTAEEIVQDAFAQALETWPRCGVPRRPAAWLATVTRNRAVDSLRRSATLRRLEPKVRAALEKHSVDSTITTYAGEIADDQLRMMFACCHPILPRQSQVALTLNVLCGFGVSEIARAFLLTDSAVEQRISRAKNKIRQHRISLAVPSPDTMESRRDAVLECLYLMFTEGHWSSRGDTLIREDICKESLRLVALLADHPLAGSPSAHALCALMLFHMARFGARADETGDLMTMADQERRCWNSKLIEIGFSELRMAMASDVLTVYHVEAGIASCHAAAPSWEETDWRAILAYYDLLMVMSPSPVVALNRAVAATEVFGPKRGLAILDEIAPADRVAGYHLYWAARGEFYLRLGLRDEASRAIRRAISLAVSEPERRHLWRRLSACADLLPRRRADTA